MTLNLNENKIYLISPNGSSYEYCTVRGLNNIGLETGVLGLGYNVLDDKIYYLCPETNDYKLYRQTLGDNELELVMSIPPNYQYSAMAINSQGQIYAVANDPPNNGKLFKINYQQNSIEYIGIIEVPLTFSQSLSFDRQTDILYGTFYEGSQKDPPYRSRVYQIDTISADIYPLSDYFDDNCQMSFSAFSPDVNDYFLTFNVTENGNPVSGATILVNNENLITGGSGSVTTMLKSGVYEYTANSPCGDTISDKLCIFSQNEAIDIDFDCTTSIENPNSNPNPINNISIYPNPADDIVNIEIEIPTKLTIYDNLLKLVFEKDLHNIKNKVSVNSLKTGVYTFKFQNDNGVIYEKVVKR